jgi:hypothetical protein
VTEGSGRGSPVLVIALAAVCIFTPQIREPIQELLDVNAAAPFRATERFVSRELDNLSTWVKDLGRPFTGGK